jgi:hypothetical protein
MLGRTDNILQSLEKTLGVINRGKKELDLLITLRLIKLPDLFL